MGCFVPSLHLMARIFVSSFVTNEKGTPWGAFVIDPGPLVQPPQ